MSIRIKPEHEGRLRSETNTPAGEKIPLSKLMAAKHSPDPKERRRATFALNARQWNS